MGFMKRRILAVVLATVTATTLAHPAFAADTIYGALAKAYENNSSLNSARAGVRVANEGVPLAKSGYRPRVTGTAGIVNSSNTAQFGGRGVNTVSFGIEIQQSIFDGFQTRNNVQSAEAGVRAERANLRNTEQNVLFDAAQAYMDVLQNRQITNLRAQNLEFLREQLRAARARFEVGEGTRTDVAQAEASLAGAQAQLTLARANTQTAEASFRALTGSNPGALKGAQPLSKLIPNSLDSAFVTAASNHPAIATRDALVDSQLFGVKAAEGAFLPSVGLSASVEGTRSNLGGGATGNSASQNTRAQIGVSLSVPIYQGGQASATVRQEKERLGQARIDGDVARDDVRQAVTSAWSQLEASRASLRANTEGVRASRLALNGVIEERDVGQRTTLDVLNAQATLIDQQVALVEAERNLVVSSYALASAVGKLSARNLGLNVKLHDVEEHYKKVKDAWFGLRTPDGR
ncbi:MAG: TolC family outer membrane protein [Pseudomonadota bacterium]